MKSIFGKHIAIFLVLSLILLGACKKFEDASSEEESLNNLERKQIYENGIRYNIKGTEFNVLMLQGTYREMGRQYGFLMDEWIVGIYDLILQDLQLAGWSQDSIINYAKHLELTQPQLIKEIIYGISETSSLSKEEQFICSSFLRVMDDPAGTSLAAWGDYTAKEPLVLGFNWDHEPEKFEKYREFLNLVIYKPKGIGNSFAEINFAGSVFFQTGINNRRMFLNMQQAKLHDPENIENRPQVQYEAYTFLLDYATTSSIEVPMASLKTNIALNINAFDVNGAISYQCPTFATNGREGKSEGFIVATNHFVDPPDAWSLETLPPQPDDYYTLERRENALGMGESYFGGFDVERMQYCMDIPLNAGGFTFSDNLDYSSIFQLVCVPVELELYIQIPGQFTWEKVELQPIFDF